MKAVPIQSSEDPRSLKKVGNKSYVSNKLPALFYMLLHFKDATTLQTGVSVLTPVCMAIIT